MRNTTLFFHPEVNGKKISRATFSISPDRDEKGTLINLLVGVALCSVHDPFVKKTGRAQALSKKPQSHTIHSLPKYVADVLNTHQKEVYYTANDFAWLSLRFL